MKTFPTTPNAGYVTTVVTTPCTISGIMPDNSTVDLLTAYEPGQYGIVAPSSTITTSQDDTLLTRVSAAVAFTNPEWDNQGILL